MIFPLLKVPMANNDQLSFLDWLVILSYIVGMLFIGWFYSRRNKTKDDYLLGGRKMNPIAIGISLFATLMSTLSYLTYPGETILHGPIILAGVLSFPLVYYIVGWWLIPRFMKMKVTSAYEILEKKLGLSVRMLAIFMFLSLRLLWMATIIYVTVDVALHSVLQFDRAYVPYIGAALTIITIFYTSMGGLKAVVVTDVTQTFIFLGGALLSIIVVCYQLGSFSSIFPATWPEHWDKLRLGFDPLERTTLGNAILVSFSWYVCTSGSDQIAVQRYLSTKDIHAARKSFGISLYSNVIAYILLGLVGLSVLAFFTHHPEWLEAGKSLNEQADHLFPRFIMIGLPPGLSGLVIAGLLAAAMSSLSAGLNSVSSVLSEDIIKRFRRTEISAVNQLQQLKNLSYVTGAVVLGLSFFVQQVPGNLLDILMKVVNLFVAPLFVLFFMALFVPFATGRATFWAGIIAIATAIAVAFWGIFGITVLWIMPVSFITGALSGVLLSLLDRTFSKKG